MSKASEAEKQEAAAKLREWFPKGSTVFTVLRHVSRSGMMRHIGVVALLPFTEGERPDVRHPNYSVGVLLGLVSDRKHDDALKVQGGGMDMGFHVAYNLSLALYGDGYALNHRWL